MENNIQHPPLRPARGVPERKHHARSRPHRTQAGGEDGVLEAGDEQGAEEGGEVLGEVCVGALGYTRPQSVGSFWFHKKG
jgi:hypothetical protein